MNKDYEFEGVYVRLALIAALFVIFLWSVSGCVRHQVEAPQLDSLAAAAKKITIEGCKRQHLTVPPIGQDVVIDIKGDNVTANAGGEELLRWYVRMRSALR